MKNCLLVIMLCSFLFTACDEKKESTDKKIEHIKTEALKLEKKIKDIDTKKKAKKAERKIKKSLKKLTK
ncbi:hypothetical protein EYV94_02520 [Puteibacter caeruleilacunae]|nr:hypothetical protein EYV94_02520 [Puteibacter caeruleilacunae]